MPMDNSISQNLGASAPRNPTTPQKRGILRRIFSMRFLVVSIALHLLFALVAAVWVVTTITAKRKLTFKGGPPSPNRSTRAIEHQVQVAKKQQSMSAPAMTKRITTTGLSKVTLPSMPAMPKSAAAPSKMAGVGGAALSLGSSGPMGSASGPSGSAISMFGIKELKGGGLIGTFYDLKQDRGRRPTDISVANYGTVLEEFTRSGWQDGPLNKYFQAPGKLSTTQIFVPLIDAAEGPKAFQVEKDVQPRLWVVLYKGIVSPPESGTFHFVGFGDDVLAVRFNGNVVLDAGYTTPCKSPLVKSEGSYDYQWAGRPLLKGQAFTVEKGKNYPMEVLIGERPGIKLFFCLLLEQQGANYQKDAKGNPILPVFRLADTPIGKGDLPPFDPKGPIWRAEAPRSQPSIFKSELPGH